jgi:hypothetical protein
MSACPEDDITPLDALTLESVKDDWGTEYDIGLADGVFLAYRLAGGDLLAADTPEGLESAIRADYTRWTTS